jgi:plastocyanin
MNVAMHRSILRTKQAAVCVLLLALLAPPTLRGAEWNVEIQNFVFTPRELEIDVGDTVIWTQRDLEGHTTTSDTGVWSSPLLFINQTFSHTFDEPGTFPYHCVPHPDMRGTIIVQSGSSGEISVQLTQPESGAELMVPGSVQLEAAVEAGEVAIVQVEFFQGESSLGIVPKSPYVLLVNLGEGEHSLTAVVEDESGASTVSDPVLVTVVRADPVAANSEVVLEAGTVTLSWNQGVGPFVLQRTPSLGDPDWTAEGAVAERSQSADLVDPVGFFRVVDSAEQEGIPFTASLSGAAERPDPVTTDATGTGLFRLEGNILTFNVWYEGLSGSATAAHIHGPAAAAGAAGVLINLEPFHGGEFGMEGTLSGQVILTPEQKAMVLSGQTYVNVHTQSHSAGEIRGQIAPVLHQVRLTGAKERPDPIDTPGSGFGTLLLVGNQLHFHVDFRDLTQPATAAHIHGPADSDTAAGVLIPLEDHVPGGFGSAGALVGTVLLSPEQLAWLVDGETYINIHTPNHAPGEIRGQIEPQVVGIPLTTDMSGDAERPDPVTTDATGTGLFRIEGDLLTFNVRYEGLTGSATAAHIHGPATADEAAGVLINLAPYNGGGFESSGTLSGQVLLTEEQRALVLGGRTYVNVHTEQHSAGELRGQIAPVLHQIALNGAKERPDPVVSTGSGFGTLLLVGSDLTFHVDYRDLSDAATAAHIHGPASTEAAAGVLVDLGMHAVGGFGESGRLVGAVVLAPNELALVIDGQTYINIHTPLHSAGEIRGQIER